MSTSAAVYNILERMADDQAFARLVEADANAALQNFDLTPAELAQIKQIVASVHQDKKEPLYDKHTN
jgi:hypothetical protein